MDILVECHSGYTYPEYPIAVTIDGTRFEIKFIAHEWLTNGGWFSTGQPMSRVKTFTVILENDQEITIKYNYLLDTWQLGSIGEIIPPEND
jgi:hypothetical protein